MVLLVDLAVVLVGKAERKAQEQQALLGRDMTAGQEKVPTRMPPAAAEVQAQSVVLACRVKLV